MPLLTRNRRVILLILVVGVGLLLLYDRTTTLLASGGINLLVRIRSEVPVREASTEVFWQRERAESATEVRSPDALRGVVSVSGLRGEPFEVWVPIDTRISGLGLTNKQVQTNYLVLVAVLADGRRVAKVVELPEANESREVTVRLD